MSRASTARHRSCVLASSRSLVSAATCARSASTEAVSCPAGASGDGETGCDDDNECSIDNGGCDPLTVCNDKPGTRTCGACPAGYSGSPLRVEVDSSRGFIGSVVYFCAR